MHSVMHTIYSELKSQFTVSWKEGSDHTHKTFRKWVRLKWYVASSPPSEVQAEEVEFLFLRSFVGMQKGILKHQVRDTLKALGIGWSKKMINFQQCTSLHSEVNCLHFPWNEQRKREWLNDVIVKTIFLLSCWNNENQLHWLSTNLSDEPSI